MTDVVLESHIVLMVGWGTDRTRLGNYYQLYKVRVSPVNHGRGLKLCWALGEAVGQEVRCKNMKQARQHFLELYPDMSERLLVNGTLIGAPYTTGHPLKDEAILQHLLERAKDGGVDLLTKGDCDETSEEKQG